MLSEFCSPNNGSKGLSTKRVAFLLATYCDMLRLWIVSFIVAHSWDVWCRPLTSIFCGDRSQVSCHCLPYMVILHGSPHVSDVSGVKCLSHLPRCLELVVLPAMDATVPAAVFTCLPSGLPRHQAAGADNRYPGVNGGFSRIQWQTETHPNKTFRGPPTWHPASQ